MTYATIFQQTPARIFSRVVRRTMKNNPLTAAMLSTYTTDELSLMRCFTTSDYSVGFAIKSDGDLVNVFNASPIKGLGSIAVQAAIELGATKLDCFDGFLPSYYAQFGFVEYKREKNWTIGQPDVVYMCHEVEPKILDININGHLFQIPA